MLVSMQQSRFTPCAMWTMWGNVDTPGRWGWGIAPCNFTFVLRVIIGIHSVRVRCSSLFTERQLHETRLLSITNVPINSKLAHPPPSSVFPDVKNRNVMSATLNIGSPMITEGYGSCFSIWRQTRAVFMRYAARNIKSRQRIKFPTPMVIMPHPK